MSFLTYFQRLFSLDTLDTRFTSSSRLPAASGSSVKPTRIDPAKPVPGLDIQNGMSRSLPSESRNRADAQPSKWMTPEFLFYFFVIIVALPLMFKSVYDVSVRKYTSH